MPVIRQTPYKFKTPYMSACQLQDTLHWGKLKDSTARFFIEFLQDKLEYFDVIDGDHFEFAKAVKLIPDFVQQLNVVIDLQDCEHLSDLYAFKKLKK